MTGPYLPEGVKRPVPEEPLLLAEHERSVMCGYCGKAFYTYPAEATERHHIEHLQRFRRHDARCARNPLAQEVRSLRVWHVRWMGVAVCSVAVTIILEFIR